MTTMITKATKIIITTLTEMRDKANNYHIMENMVDDVDFHESWLELNMAVVVKNVHVMLL